MDVQGDYVSRCFPNVRYEPFPFLVRVSATAASMSDKFALDSSLNLHYHTNTLPIVVNALAVV